jgi:hypothetical protein
MISIRSFSLSVIPLAMLASATANADAIFDFQNVAAGTVAPLTTTVNGLTASVSGPISVCNVAGANFATLSGNALIQGFCTPGQLGAVTIGFSSNLSSVSLDFATAGRPSAPFTLQAFENSSLVGSSTFTSSVPPGNAPNGEGVASFSGLFNSIVLNTVGATPGSQGGPFAVDNVNAITATAGVPEPASLSMFAAGGVLLLGLARGFRKRRAS